MVRKARPALRLLVTRVSLDLPVLPRQRLVVARWCRCVIRIRCGRGRSEGFSGLLSPYFRSVNTDVNAPLAIAIFSFIFVEFWGLTTLGLGYLKKFFNFGRLAPGNPMGIIDVFVGLLELVSELSRMVSFTFRLFGNVFAGEVLLLMMTFLVPFVLVNVFYGLELFVGLIQAFVFAMLTLVFAQTAVSMHGDGHEGEHGEAGH